jgi:hypothetical protein
MSKRAQHENTTRRQKQRTQSQRNQIQNVPSDVGHYYSKFLEDADVANFASTSKSIHHLTSSMKNCHKETKSGLACANDVLASVQLREECFHFCRKHLQLVICNIINTFLHTEVIANNGNDIFTFYRCGIVEGVQSLTINKIPKGYLLLFDYGHDKISQELDQNESVQTFFKQNNIIWNTPQIFLYLKSNQNNEPRNIVNVISYLEDIPISLNPANFKLHTDYIEAFVHVQIPNEKEEIEEEMKEETKEVKQEIDCLQLTQNKLGCTGLLKHFIIDPNCFQFCQEEISDAIIHLLNMLSTNQIFGQDDTSWTFEFLTWSVFVYDNAHIIFEFDPQYDESDTKKLGNIVAENIDLESPNWNRIEFVLNKSNIVHPILGERKLLSNLILHTSTKDLQLTGYEEDEDVVTLVIFNPLHLNMEHPD